MTPPQVKQCSKCGEEKSLDMFRNNGAGYYTSYCKACHSYDMKQKYMDNPQHFKDIAFRSQLKSKYGLTPDDFDAMWADQNGCCAICDRALSRGTGKFGVDHNHLTGQVRALLCGMCNMGLGKFRDTPGILDRAAQYLRTYGHYGSEAPQCP